MNDISNATAISVTEKNRFEKARLSRDARFDGKFFIAVKTTGIFCRTVCPVRLPKSENIDFYKSAAQALDAGFRPCLRCRPETAPHSPAWNGTQASVSRGLKLIALGYLNEASVADLAEKLGITERHLLRLFQKHLSTTPSAIAQYNRLQKAKLLIDNSNLSMVDIAAAAGYQSVRRFNSHVKAVYSKSPSALRKKPKRNKIVKSQLNNNHYLEFRLAYRPPYNWQNIMQFLQVRAAPGVEVVKTDINGQMSYHRIITVANKSNPSNTEAGLIEVFHDEANSAKAAIVCRLYNISSANIFHCVERIKRIFDLSCDISQVEKALSKDKVIKSLVKQNPGVRVPGCWHEFEIAVRAVIGQQVSVVGATTVLGRLIKNYGTSLEQVFSKALCQYANDLGLTYQYPSPDQLANLDETTMSMPVARAMALKTLAQQVANKEIDFSADKDNQSLSEQLQLIKGIGPWTANYVAMRASGDPDAFLYNDLVLQKKAAVLYGLGERVDDKTLLSLAKKWQPWRAYASMYIWQS